MNNSLFYFVSSSSLDMPITAKLLLARWFCLSNKGTNEISYTQYAALSEGFSERSYKRAKKFLLDNGFIQARVKRSGQAVSLIEVKRMTDEDYIVIQVPKQALEHLKTPAERFIFGRLYALSYDMTKEVQYSYEELSEDLGLSVSCCKKTISNLNRMGYLQSYKSYNPFTRTYENHYSVFLPNPVNEELMVCKNGTEQSAKITQGKCQNYTSNVPKVHSPHLLMNNNEGYSMNKEQPHEINLPKSFKDIKPLFDDYMNKYSEVKPELKNLNTTDLAIQFFEYFDSRHWIDSSKKPVDPATLRQRVATWMKHVNIPVVQRRTQTPSKPNFEYDRSRSIFRHIEEEESFNNAIEVQS